ncbi:hypothetical protein BGZ61DRAFT_529332 [Ilyonectria robusta]|uniref:uncharacterized protein n=1 Tax=Ilyonectria robusta TaxID=1079257 RepID=UPI001E8EF15A|nr:uncharacterized protein BGZ61DRAFT_529332 [Ilyonectria robusta]KAH8734130.1 hypothetical protein BGZ61DRAFT_529332 [Ilyonectria robusta]
MSRESNNHGPYQGAPRGPPDGHAMDDFDSHNTGPQPVVYQRKFESLQHQLASANSNIDTLKAELQVKDEQAAQLKKRNSAMQSSRDAQEELLGRQEQDLTILANFEGISLQLKSWTSKFCNAANNPMTVTGIQKDNLSQIRRVLPSLQDHEDLPRFLPPNDLRRRRKFVRGWVGLILAETMIRSLPVPSHPASSGHDLWMPPEACGAVRELETTLLSSGEAVALAAFHRWRTTTMALLSKVYPPGRWPRDTINSVEDKVDFTLEVILPLTSQPDIGELRQKLIDNIFLPALEFSQLLRRQCASWSVRFPPLISVNPLPHDECAVVIVIEPSTMEDMDSQPEDDLETSVDHCLKSVEIVVTPALFKSGKHDGLRYDTESTRKRPRFHVPRLGGQIRL